jgi:acyl carrier protein
MDRATALEGIQEVVRDVLGEDDLVIGEDTTAGSIDGWDSMAHVNIIIGVEKRFGLRLKAADLAGLRSEGATVGQIVDLVAGRA